MTAPSPALAPPAAGLGARLDRLWAPDRAEPYADPTPRGLIRGIRHSGAIAFAAPSLIFLVFPIAGGWSTHGPLLALAVTAVCLVYGLVFVGSLGVVFMAGRWRALWLVLAWALVGILAFISSAEYMGMYQVLIHMMVLPWRHAKWVAWPVAALFVIASTLTGAIFGVLLSLAGLAFGLGMGSSIHQSVLQEQLAEERDRNASLAVFAERARIGRDLHDILGHSLTTITVSAQLAARLVETAPEAAAEKLREIEALSRTALADVRATSSGLLQVRVASEIASARQILAAAGIDAHTPSAIPELDDARAELWGYVVREGVTNVVRHSEATTCRIVVEADRVLIQDDGVGIPAEAPLSGLAGLRARVEAAGGSIELTPAQPGTVLEARVTPGEGAA
ncbi:MAG: sensor histidine kinase [Dermabacter sp.]|nr:sensor histidine kinase [Dermabacter sp.]